MAVSNADKERINRALPANRAVDLGGKLQAIDARVAETQAATVAVDIAALKTDFNALLSKLKAAGLMANS
ncbi:hypothetical protein KQR54_18315 [Mycobacterium gordonae]|nr:hypothetical protein [Mycobacterium gordonae]